MANAVDQRSWVRQGWDSFWELSPQGETQRFSVLTATSSFFLAKRVFTAINPWTAAALTGTICLVSKNIFYPLFENSKKRDEDAYFLGACKNIVTIGLEVLAASAWMSSVQAIAFVAITNVSANFVGSVVSACLAGYQLLTAKPEDDSAAAGNGDVNDASGGGGDGMGMHDAAALDDVSSANDNDSDSNGRLRGFGRRHIGARRGVLRNSNVNNASDSDSDGRVRVAAPVSGDDGVNNASSNAVTDANAPRPELFTASYESPSGVSGSTHRTPDE